ncbi:ribosome small subunit-dependent GTPase A [Rossellomorea arthrocnemi]|jgi:ribosome biogenesis GTPase / thiamine phosphate phosphatase|uniref:ribosome small subunit-dependent GTPase A n=1 Tax=Rossellomorea arthrocnemi TaxID=2769542 RepID=UPI0019194594|nr:ribosome small subunit-dependent GTPase A [Rossellomorea arthrocnemi]
MELSQLGWNLSLAEKFSEYKEYGYEVGRIVLEHKNSYRVMTEAGEMFAEVSGKFRHIAEERSEFPAVGDWVAISILREEGKATIHGILPRFSKFSRRASGESTEEQIVATNINTVFLVMSLNNDFNIRRIERYLITAWESGANPVIVLSKTDLCDDIESRVKDIEDVAPGVPIHAISATEGVGLEPLKGYCLEGKTVALLGSSGVGKSTICNYLFGADKQQVKEVRDRDDRGKHTTTHRELIILPDGGILIDTPGMRELQLWNVDNSMMKSFSDIEVLAKDCKFNDCQHEYEPSCRVKRAIEEGLLDQKRYDNYKKFQKELAFLDRQTNKRSQLLEKEKWKKVSGDRTRSNRR